MKTRRSAVPPSAFGLIGWLESTRVSLPLKGVECRFQVTGGIGCVEVDQIYHQDMAEPIDCTYSFPLPAGAAVYRCELHVNGRVIRAKVEEQATARRIFAEQKAAGRRAALVETERDNLFTLSLGNVQPGDLIVMRFAWFQVLDRTDDGLRLFVPTCPGVRYVPGKPLLRSPSGRGTVDDTDQVPDASRITPPRIDDLHPDAAYFSIEGRLSCADAESGTLSSPSHPIYVRESNGEMAVTLSTRGAVPDRDFVLAWREPKAAQLRPQAWAWTEGAETYALVQLRAPENVAVTECFPQDFYFLVDRSGSMAGGKWNRTCEALHAFVRLLGADDRVWITLFETGFQDFAEAPMPAPAVLADRHFRSLASMGTGGGTELLPAAGHVLSQIGEHSTSRRATVVLITDGQVGNDREILRTFQKSPEVTVHTFGIDTTVNDAFLKSLAEQQNGGCWLQTPDDDIAGTIAALGDRLRRPVVTDLSVSGGWVAAREKWPALHAREVITLALRGETGALLRIAGQMPDGSPHEFTVDLGAAGSEAVKLLWARERIATHLAAEQKAEAIALARDHNLICEGTAFIAWDEIEQVQVAMEEVVQPAMQPHRKVPPTFFARSLSSLPGHTCSDFVCEAGLDADDSRGFEECPAQIGQSAVLPTEIFRQEFRSTGLSVVTVDALLNWAAADDTETVERVSVLLVLAEFFTQIQSYMKVEMIGLILEKSLLRALSGPATAVIAWTDAFRVICGKAPDLDATILAAASAAWEAGGKVPV